MREFFKSVIPFYLEGFRGMRLGRVLWKIVLLKLFILFAVLKPFFFPDVLEINFASDAERANHVLALLAGGEEIQNETARSFALEPEQPRTEDRQAASHHSETTRR